MNAFTLKHNTSRDSIEARNKAELIAALTTLGTFNSRGMNPGLFKKGELVEIALNEVANLTEEHTKKEAAAKAAHDAAVEAEKANPTIAAVKADFLAALEMHDALLAKVDAEFAEYAKSAGLAYAIEWRAAGVFEAASKRRELAGLIGFAKSEVENPCRLIAEYIKVLEDEAASATDRVLDAYIGHSTNPVANLKSEYELKAKGWAAKSLARTVASIRKAVETNDASRLWVYFG